MFKNARLKLTAWYILILMIISVSFSAIIYKGAGSEIDRLSQIEKQRIERRFQENNINPMAPKIRFIDPELLEETKHRFLLILIVINGGIIFFVGSLSYFLAGKTLQPIQKMVEEQNRFISDASHELRTPLTAMKSSLEVNLRDKNLSLTDAKKLIEESITDVNKLQSLSDSLLDLSRYQTPSSTSNLKNILINDGINETIKKISPLSKQKNIIIKTDVKKIFIRGNENDLINLFTIIIDNAIKYSPKNTLIKVSAKQIKNKAVIEIEDQGVGIEKKDLPLIFDRFYRADQSRSKEKISGYGLGLSIAKKIVLKYNGNISVISKINKGTKFLIDFPISV